MEDQPRLQILKMIEAGKLSAEEGIRLLNALSGSSDAEGSASEFPPPPAPHSGEREPLRGSQAQSSIAPAPQPAAPQPPPGPRALPPNFRRWQNWWLIPFFIGGVIATVSAVLMGWAWGVADNRLSVWVVLAACPFAFGVAVLVLAFLSRTAKWIHIRLNTGRDEFPRRIALSLPAPFGPLSWLVNVVSVFNPELRERGVSEMITALGSTTSRDTPLYVEIDGAKSGEKVQVYIG